MTWTDEKIKKLKKLWQKGCSTVEIAKELGISKNAVVGKVHRLELESRPSPIKKKVKKVAETSNNAPQLIGLMDLKINSCRWPIGDPEEDGFHFCGAETSTGKPYCPEHCKIAYTSLKELTLQNAKAKKERQELEEKAQAEREEEMLKKSAQQDAEISSDTLTQPASQEKRTEITKHKSPKQKTALTETADEKKKTKKQPK